MSTNKRWLCLSVGILSAGLVGCQSVQSNPDSIDNAPPVAALEQQLADAAQSVASSLRTLAKTQSTRQTVSVLDTAPLLTPEGGMGGTAMLDWSGPVEPLLQKIAALTHYQLKVLGNPPSIPVLVNIEGNERPIADILKDASLQTGKQANIVVYPSVKIIELRYQVL